MERWFCGKYQKFMNKQEIGVHNCMHREKGRNKGRKCRLLIMQEYYEVG